MTTESRRNWAGNYTYQAAKIHEPATIEEVSQIVRGSAKVKALGTRHSFNGVADTQNDIISMRHFSRVLELDHARKRVTIESGVRYGELGVFLHREGYALKNLASLPHISVAGACATATHGSGEKNGNLATEVVGWEMIDADGQIVSFSRDGDGEAFNGMVVSLGALGVVTKLTLEIVPTFQVRQNVYENLPLTELFAHFDEIEASAYSVSLFTDWQSDRINQVWRKSLVGQSHEPPAKTFFGAVAAPADRHPIASVSAVNCTAQMNVAGPWHERLPHFRMDYTPSSGNEIQAEYFVPREAAVEAIGRIAALARQLGPILFISEIRAIAADELWLSPCYRRPSVAIHFTFKPDWPGVRKMLPVIERELAPLHARPHWGKVFTIPADRLAALYDKMNSFREMVNERDPSGKFRNAFLNEQVFGGI
jgi:xylitol oxidase